MILLLTGLLALIIHLRRKAETGQKSIQQYEHHLALLADHLTSIIVFQLKRNRDGRFAFTFLSKGYENNFGLSRTAIMDNAAPFFDRVWKEDSPLLQKAYLDAKEKPQPVLLEFRINDADGKMKWLRLNAIPSQEADDLFWGGFVQDITTAKKVEDTLASERQNFTNLFNTIDEYLLVCDKEGNILHANPALANSLGYHTQELYRLNLKQLYSPYDSQLIIRQIASLNPNTSASNAIPLRGKSNRIIPVEMSLIKGVWHNQEALFAVARDTARHKTTENALRESQEMLQLIMNAIPISVFWKNRDSVYIGCNRTFARECNRSDVTDIIGKNPHDLFTKEIANIITEQDRQVLSTNSPMLNFMQSHTISDGSIGWREASKIPLHDENGEPVGILGLWRDVTEQSRAEERLKRTLEDMERFNQLMRGRERRTLELKAEVNKLLEEQGKHIKYRTSSETLS
jgi:PAS domain S-box-containing protein